MNDIQKAAREYAQAHHFQKDYETAIAKAFCAGASYGVQVCRQVVEETFPTQQAKQ